MAYSISNTDQQMILATSAIITYVGGVMLVLGTMGNLMNIIVFSCLKSYHSLPTSAFLAIASFTGEVYLIFSSGFETLSKWVGYDIASSNSAICKSYLYIRQVSVQISLTCLCLASIDRYLMTSRSARRRELITLKRVRLLICVCVVVWMCAEIPSALYTQNLSIFKLCTPSLDYISTATYLNLVFAIFLPITILSVFGLLTWKNLGNTRLSALNSQVTKMILLDVIAVALSNIPLGCFVIYAATVSTDWLFTPTADLVATLIQTVSVVQASGSFYFYMIVSAAFRSNVKNMLRNVLCFWKPRIGHQIVPSVVAAVALPIATAAAVPSKIPDVVV